MEVKKSNDYIELFLVNQRFVLDPSSFRIEPPLILTDPSLNVNKDKIFNSPGEFNVGDVYFYGFKDQNSISYLFNSEEGIIFYYNNEVSEETIKKIKSMKIEIDALISKKAISEKIINDLKPKIIITEKEFDLAKFTKQKAEKFKINLKKVHNSIFILK